MIRIALCDDSPEQLAKVSMAVEDFVQRKHIETPVVAKYSNPLILLDDLSNEIKYDVFILDVCMPELDGINLAKEIRNRVKSAEIIFISVFPEFAVDAFDLNAVHYVLKPFKSEAFDEAMKRALSSIMDKTAKVIPIQLGNGVLHSVSIYDILYIESIAYKRVIHTKDGVYEEVRRSLSGFAEILDVMAPGQFIQPYRGYIVNMSAISTISPSCITLVGNDRVLIKRGDFRKLRKAFLDWIFSERTS